MGELEACQARTDGGCAGEKPDRHLALALSPFEAEREEKAERTVVSRVTRCCSNCARAA